MKKIAILTVILSSIAIIATAQSFNWSPLSRCIGRGSGELSRSGIHGSAGINQVFTDYSDNRHSTVDGIYWNIGLFTQAGPLRIDAQYWNAGTVYQYSQQLPGTAVSKYQGGEVLINFQPIPLLYIGLGGGVIDANVEGSETNQNLSYTDFQVYPTAQIGTEIPFTPYFSVFLNYQVKFDLSGRKYDYYLPPQPFVNYDKTDWLNTISLGAKLYLIY